MLHYCITVSCILLLSVIMLVNSASGPLRVEVELKRLNNSLGQLQNGQSCDLTSACDHKITGYLDTDKPLSTWPGDKAIDKWTLVFEKDNDNTPVLNKIVSRDVCAGSSVTRANLRMNVVDTDSLTKNDLVEQFECMVPIDSLSSTNSQWSTERPCVAKYHPRTMGLNYRYRVLPISSAECGRTPVASG